MNHKPRSKSPERLLLTCLSKTFSNQHSATKRSRLSTVNEQCLIGEKPWNRHKSSITLDHWQRLLLLIRLGGPLYTGSFLWESCFQRIEGAMLTLSSSPGAGLILYALLQTPCQRQSFLQPPYIQRFHTWLIYSTSLCHLGIKLIEDDVFAGGSTRT